MIWSTSIAMLLLTTGITGSPPECSVDDTEAMKGLSQDTNKFGWDLFKEVIRKSKADDNVFLSAPSISAAFGMLYLGAREDSAKEIKQAMFPNVADSTITSGYLSLLSKLKPSSGKFQLSLANGAFVAKTAQLLDSYINGVKKCFHSEVKAMDFENKPEEERQAINTWISDKTQERIKDLLPPRSISSATKLVLANAIYFKSQWHRTFNKNDTRNMTFVGANNVETKTEMMTMDLGNREFDRPHFAFYEDRQNKIKIIELPYTGKEISMVILLPENQEAYKKAEKDLSHEFVNNLQTKMQPTKLSQILVPKWKVTHDLSLTNLMNELNITSVFEGSRADLSGITGTKNLFVSDAIHKAFVEVNEEGTEAAAATGVIMVGYSGRIEPPKPSFIADRPFIYILLHKSTNTALFIGRHVTPS